MRTNDEDHESEADEKLAVALEASPIIAFAQDLELRLTWLHNQRQDVPPEAYLGKTDYDLNAPEDAERLTALKRRVLETGKPARAEVYLEARAVWFDMSVRPRMRDGRICGVIGTAIDITERRRAEEAQLDRGLEIIERNAKLKERMINDLLDVSRIISGQLRTCRFEIPAAGSPPSICRTCSSASVRWTARRRAVTAAWVSAWLSFGTSSRRMAAPSRRRATAWIEARRSRSCFRSAP